MRKWIVWLSFLGMLSGVQAQSPSFNADPTSRTLNFPANEYVFYAYMNLYNLDTADLPMRWEKSFPIPFPAAWENRIQDPDSFYVAGEMQGDFILQYQPPFPQKIICQFFPNQTADNAIVEIRLVNLNDTNETMILQWAANTVATSTEPENDTQISLFPNPAQDWIEIRLPENKPCFLTVWEASGREMITQRPISNAHRLSLSDWQAGIYGFRIEDAKGGVMKTGILRK